MTKDEYINEIKQIDLNAEKLKIEVIKKYCLANNPVKTGDVVSDSSDTIKVKKIGFYLTINDPCCTYSGPRVKKDGTPFKDDAHFRVYQSNIKSHTPIGISSTE